jgi:hypothetical protein
MLTGLGVDLVVVLRLARTLKLQPWLRRPGNPDVFMKRSHARLQRVRTAKPLKLRRHLGVIQIWIIAAAGADEFIHVGVAAFETAVHDANRLAPQGRLAAVAGLTGERRCHNAPRLDTSHGVTAVARTRCGDGGRTGRRSGARTVH